MPCSFSFTQYSNLVTNTNAHTQTLLVRSFMERACNVSLFNQPGPAPSDVLILNRPTYLTRKRFIENVGELEGAIRALGVTYEVREVPSSPCDQVCSQQISPGVFSLYSLALLFNSLCPFTSTFPQRTDQTRVPKSQSDHLPARNAHGQLPRSLPAYCRCGSQPTAVLPAPVLQAQDRVGNSLVSICVE